MDRPVVAVTCTVDRPVDLDLVHRKLDGIADIRVVDYPDGPLPERRLSEIVNSLRPAAAVFMRTGSLPKAIIDSMPNLKIAALHGAGVDQVDVAAATERGVYVTNAPGGNSEAVAEFAFAMMLSVMRRLVRADRLIRLGDWTGGIVHGSLLSEKTIGVVGLGQIGSRVARIAHGFEMSVLAYDPYAPRAKFLECAATPISLAGLLQESDVVSLHLPISEETRNLIDAAALGLMKPSSIIINTARGALVDEDALVIALREGRIGGAGLDTFREEPVHAENPLLSFDNVVVSPHMAGVAVEVLQPIAQMATSDIARTLEGKYPVHIANPAVSRVISALQQQLAK